MNVTRTVIAATIASIAASANADSFTWDWSGATPDNASISDVAGEFESVHAEFDAAAQTLLWRVVFADKETEGLTFAISSGLNPKGHAGELALIYVDAENLGEIRTSVYAYNGKNLVTSYKDGDGNQSGDQTPDRIHSYYDFASPLRNATAYDDGDRRVFELEFDTSVINSHTPMYPGSSPWTGIGFAHQLGLWMHSFSSLDAEYNNDGYLTQWDYDDHGFFDGHNQRVSFIPLPSAAAMGIVGLSITAGRRRR